MGALNYKEVEAVAGGVTIFDEADVGVGDGGGGGGGGLGQTAMGLAAAGFAAGTAAVVTRFIPGMQIVSGAFTLLGLGLGALATAANYYAQFQ